MLRVERQHPEDLVGLQRGDRSHQVVNVFRLAKCHALGAATFTDDAGAHGAIADQPVAVLYSPFTRGTVLLESVR